LPAAPRLRQFERDLFAEDVFDRQGKDAPSALLEERLYLGQGVLGIIEWDEKAFLTVFTDHNRLKSINIGSASRMR
jgi:hypothetical protein